MRETALMLVEALRAGYGKRDAISIDRLEFDPRIVTVIIGPNGSGKSTLMRCLSGALNPTKGRITLDNCDVSRIKAAQRARKIAYVPQEAQYPFTFTVAELIQMGAEAGGLTHTEANTQIEEALNLFELMPMAGKSLTALSGGERQRAALARAFAQGSGLLLLDEPTAHLDLRYQTILRDALRKAAREEKRGSIVVLHDLNLAAGFADRVVLLEAGEVAASGTPENTLTMDTIRRVYQTDIRIIQDIPTGGRWIAPSATAL